MMGYGFHSKKIVRIILLAVGALSLAYGVIGIQFTPEEAHDASTLLGMFAGFGAGLLAVAVFFLLRDRMMSPQKRRQQEIEENDERSIALKRAAFSVSWTVALLLFALLAFAFVAMGLRVASYLCLGALYVQFFSYLVAHRVLKRKM